MKIAIIGSVIHVAPTRKGVIHAPLKLTFDLAKKLDGFGHDVTFFGLVNEENAKEVNFKINALGYDNNAYEKSRGLAPFFFDFFEQEFVSRVLNNKEEFDLYYFYAAYRIGPIVKFINSPIVTTHHDSTHISEYEKLYANNTADNFFMIPISKFMKNRLRFKNYLNVVHHGIEADKIPVFEPKNYFCWVGRIAPPKGLHIAIKLAKKMKFKLKIAGSMSKYSDFDKDDKYNEDILKEIRTNSNIEYLGTISQKESYKLISQSRGLIFPTDGTESFSMITIESMMAGVPVISTRKGPIPELVRNRKTGFLVKDQDDIKGFEKAIRMVEKFDRDYCRKNTKKRFSLDIMARNYEREFLRAIKKYKGKNVKN